MKDSKLKAFLNEKIKLFDGPTKLVEKVKELTNVALTQESSFVEEEILEFCPVTDMPLYEDDVVHFLDGEAYADFKAIQNKWGIDHRHYKLICVGYNVPEEYESGNGEEMEECFAMSNEEFEAWFTDHLDGWSTDFDNGIFPLENWKE